MSLPPPTDLLRPFQLERSGIRGRLVRLADTVDEVLRAHDYPERVGRLLGELLALAGGLAGGLKFDGMFSLQIRGQGAIRLMVADCTNDGQMRGYASFDAGLVAAAPDDQSLFGEGLLALTVDQSKAGGEIQQGIVTLDNRNLTEAMLVYFRDSEQVRTGIRVAVDRDPGDGRWRAGALVVQALPQPVGHDPEEAEDRWHETMLLLSSTADDELTDPGLAPDELLYRLFHERGVRVFEPILLEAHCSCTEERVKGMLAGFPPSTLEEMRMPDGSIEVTCQFCNHRYLFDPARLERLNLLSRH